MKHINNEKLKYLISSTLSFVIDIVILYFLTECLFLNYLLSGSISISIGFTLNYFINVKWVFNKRVYINHPFIEYFYMILISLFISLINIILLWILTELILIYYLFSKLIVSIITLILKFILRKKILFN